VLKQVIDVIAPFVIELSNRSLSEGHFPAVFKEAFVTPVVKKPGLDAIDTSSYRPISNLSVLSKLLGRLVVSHLMKYLMSADLLPLLQSGFRNRIWCNLAVKSGIRDKNNFNDIHRKLFTVFGVMALFKYCAKICPKLPHNSSFTFHNSS